eukprot:12431443-Karenia_brevis.AAC.1
MSSTFCMKTTFATVEHGKLHTNSYQPTADSLTHRLTICVSILRSLSTDSNVIAIFCGMTGVGDDGLVKEFDMFHGGERRLHTEGRTHCDRVSHASVADIKSTLELSLN